MDAAAESEHPSEAALAETLHYVSDIPQPPEVYIAHPYTLLQVRKLEGRKHELELLTDWVTNSSRFRDVRVFSLVAIGGMGKSALTWTWFNDIAPQEMAPLAGRVWWSFYESDATFENFVTRALAYASRQPLDEVKRLSYPEREDRLLAALNQQPFLLVLDGLERILMAYARLGAAYLRDEQALDEETENRVAGAMGLPKSAGQSFVGRHKLRKTADVRAGRFLRELSRVRASRILVSTRLYPADLQAPMGNPLPGCFAVFLPGLSDLDALALWRAFGAKGSREEMLPVFRTFENHPLLIQLLAHEVADFRDAPGDFDAWKAANPNFNPFGLELANVQSHVLAYAMRGLSAAELRTLHVIAGFRMPASMETIKALLVRTDKNEPVKKPFATLRELDAALTALEDRGLLGWDRRANRYDLHPVVRGVVWTGLDDDSRTDVYGTLRIHFQPIATVDVGQVESVEDLAPAIELYHTLIGLGLYDDAYDVFVEKLDRAMLDRLSASRLRAELLEGLFPNALTSAAMVERGSQSSVLNALGLSYYFTGRPSGAISPYEQAAAINLSENDVINYAVNRSNLSSALRHCGRVRDAESAARIALFEFRRAGADPFKEGAALYYLAAVLVIRGEYGVAKAALVRALRIWHENLPQSKSVICALLAEVAIAQNDPAGAEALARQAWDSACVNRFEGNLIRAARLQGTVALSRGDFATASERLHHALARAQAVSRVEEEVPALISLSEWHHRIGETAQARAMLDDVWEPAERGPYPLFRADALNVLAQIERDAGNTEAAVIATEAYRLAWSDGPPFAYHWGLEKAKAHLAALGAPEPVLPLFDESQHEPMPEVEINPADEFGGE